MANPGILGWMKNMYGFLAALALFSAGCHRPDKTGNVVPVPPAPLHDSRVPAESAALSPPPAASASTTSSTSETIAPIIEHSGIAKYSINELLLALADAYFDLDQHEVRPDARVALRSDASTVQSILAQSPGSKIVLEGHCDERGSAEYNLALGAMRAEAAKGLLIEFGIPNTALKTISYGKERPQCTTPTEECWQKNRRAHLAPQQ